jgi:uroporphyrinogen decarboxylase
MLRPHLSRGRLVSALTGKTIDPPPIWLMRQAGRYLPEYRDVRAKAGSFLDLCLNPALAAEVTLQPLRRFDLDAAIVFSDILMVPHALGQKVEFIEGEGPKLAPLHHAEDLARLDPVAAERRFAPVYETLARIGPELPDGVPVIGFCGAPWTVATYMVEGGGSKEQAEARLWAYRDPASFQQLIDLLVEASIGYLRGQVEAGAGVLQIFDSWAGNLPDDEFASWCIHPTRAIVAGVRAAFPDIPIIGFPRGCGASAERYAQETGIDAIGCDTSMSLAYMRETLQGGLTVQGNLDPLVLVAGGAPLDRRTKEILARLSDRPFVFNLGHGILPETPPEHVARLVELVKRKA